MTKAQMAPETVVKLVLVVVLIAAIIIFALNFKSIISFFKNLGGGEVIPSCSIQPLTGTADKIGFKIGTQDANFNGIVTMTREQNIELAVILKSSCDKIEYTVNFINPSSPGFGDTLMFSDDCITDINTALNNLNLGTYNIVASCVRAGKTVTINSGNLDVK